MQAVLEAGGDTEVAPAAADRPEQIRMVLSVGPQEPAVGGDDVGGQQVVDREPVFANEVADAAAQGQPSDPDRAGVAEADRQTVRPESARDLAGGQAALGPGDAPVGIDFQRLHQREVEHDPSFADAVARTTVAAAADGQLEPALT